MKSVQRLDRLLSPRTLAIVFCLQAILAVSLLAILVPPFENSDEYNHFERADQISRLGLIATRFAGPGSSGGLTDPGIDRIDDLIRVIRFHPEMKIGGDRLRDANAIGWGRPARLNFLNTAIYSPVLYFPAVAGLWTGKLLHVSIVRTMILSRIATGISCVLLAGIAIAGAGEAALYLFVLLSLPMVLSLFASVSQDGLMIAAAANGVMLLRLIRDRLPLRPDRAFWLLCVALLVLCLGRPAYIPFAVIPLLVPGISARRRASGALLVVAGTLAWCGLTTLFTISNGSSDRGVAPGAQLKALLLHPDRIPSIAWNTFAGRQGMEGESYLHELIGVLGWIDTRLPPWFYRLSSAAIAIATIVTAAQGRAFLAVRAQGMLFMAALLSVGFIFLLLYLTWSPLGFPFVDGVQGRYFLPIMLLVPVFLPAPLLPRLRRWCMPVQLLLLVYPALSIVVTIVTVVRRYYV